MEEMNERIQTIRKHGKHRENPLTLETDGWVLFPALLKFIIV